LSRKGKYAIGDIFEIVLEPSGVKGYGRILKIDEPSIFVELYGISPHSEFVAEEIERYDVLLKIWCTDNGFKKKEWKLIANVPIKDEVEMPDFWTKDALTGKLMIVRGEERFEATEDQKKSAQPYGIFGHEAVRLKLVYELKNVGLY
jgi:hypothetical protein